MTSCATCGKRIVYNKKNCCALCCYKIEEEIKLRRIGGDVSYRYFRGNPLRKTFKIEMSNEELTWIAQARELEKKTNA